jgi:hypothetical protein
MFTMNRISAIKMARCVMYSAGFQGACINSIVNQLMRSWLSLQPFSKGLNMQPFNKGLNLQPFSKGLSLQPFRKGLNLQPFSKGSSHLKRQIGS